MKKQILVGSLILIVSLIFTACGSSINAPSWLKGTWGNNGIKALEVTNNEFIMTSQGQSADWVKFGKVETNTTNDVYTFSVKMEGIPDPTKVTITKKDDNTINIAGHFFGAGKDLKKM